jgi:hypothetical protein
MIVGYRDVNRERKEFALGDHVVPTVMLYSIKIVNEKRSRCGS